MYVKWASVAFIRFTFCYICGILIYYFGSNSLELNNGILIIIGVGYLTCLIILKKHQRRKNTFLFSLLSFSFLIIAGYINTANHDASKSAELLHPTNKIIAYTGNIASAVRESSNGCSYILKLDKVKTSTGWQISEGKVNIYFPFKSGLPKYNDHILLNSYPKEIPSPLNPGEFNFQKYLYQQQIYFQDYVERENLLILKQNNRIGISGTAYLLRNYFKNCFKKYIVEGDEQAIALALVLGIKDQLDSEIKQEYAGVGAMHVLAVSGLHVGIILQMLSFILFFIKKKKYGKWFFGIIVGCILWFYAAITGFSPSVVRATTMFSFVLLSNVINRKSSIYNTLAISALCMLIYDPYYIFQVGFQLSYIAVFGIVYLYPKIYYLNQYPLGRFLDNLWKISAVSIAAQIATFPISLFYFHQFPVYFLLANPIVIITAIIVVWAGIFLPFFALTFAPIALVTGKLITSVIYFMNKSISIINSFPFSQTNPFAIKIHEILLLYLIIILIVQFFEKKKLLYIKLTTVIILIISISSTYDVINNSRIKRLTVHHINKHTCLSIIHNNKAFVLTDSTLFKDKTNIDHHLMQYLLEYGINDYELFSINYLNNFPFPVKQKDNLTLFSIKGSTITLVSYPIPNFNSLKTDLLIINNNAFYNTKQLKYINSDYCILDGSNSFKTFYSLSNESKNSNINLIYTKKNGALILDL